MPSQQLDATDWKILGRLQDDARISNVDLARAVNPALGFLMTSSLAHHGLGEWFSFCRANARRRVWV